MFVSVNQASGVNLASRRHSLWLTDQQGFGTVSRSCQSSSQNSLTGRSGCVFESFRFYKNAAREKKGANNPVLPVQAKPNFDPVHIQQKILFAGLLNHPQLIEEYYEPFLDLDITSDKLRRLRDQIILKINETPALDSGLLQHHLHNEGFTDLLDDILNEDVYKHA